MILKEREGYTCYYCNKHISKTIDDWCVCVECFEKYRDERYEVEK